MQKFLPDACNDPNAVKAPTVIRLDAASYMH